MDSLSESKEIFTNVSDIGERLRPVQISDQDKTKIILVSKHAKPATFFDLWYYPDLAGEYSETRWREDIEMLTNLFTDLSLPVDVTNAQSWKSPYSDEGLAKIFRIGKDQQHLEHLLRALQLRPSPEYHRALGFALGYPESAVEAFLKGPAYTMTVENFPPEIRESDEFKFRTFSLSRSDWPDEFESVKQAATIVRQVDPQLYQKIVSSP